MRLLLRSIVPIAIVAGLSACFDSPHAPVRQAGAGARIALAPVFSRAASAAAANLASFGLSYDHVRVTIVRPPMDTVKDTTIAFSPESDNVSLDLAVDVHEPSEPFDAAIDYSSNGRVVFRGTGRVQAHTSDESASAPNVLSIEYVGPGASATKLVIAPRVVSVVRNETRIFTAAAFDANDAPVPDALVAWVSSNPGIATISSDGELHSTGASGTVTITASTPSGASDNTSVTVVQPPASISLLSGGGQVGKVGTALPAPAVVQVSGADGVGVPGITVVFAPPTGADAGATTATTDAAGRASATLMLGKVAGAQSFVATTGDFSVAIPATALAGAPASIVALSGSGQSDTARSVVSPLVARVTDQFGNPAPNVVVSWTTSSPVAALGASVSTTGADGRAAMKYTLGSVPGVETVSATVAGVADPAVFTLRTLDGPPARISIVSGDRQSGVVGTSGAAPLVVKVTDASGAPASGTTVLWTSSAGAIAGQTTTDALGLSTNTLTMGTRVGPVVVTASLANGAASVSFGLTAVAGKPAALTFLSQPTFKLALLLSPVSVMVVDSYGNQTTSTDAVTISVPTGLAALLTGTLTRAAVNGVATFDDLSLNFPGASLVLIAKSGSLPQAVSAPIGSLAPGFDLQLLNSAMQPVPSTLPDTITFTAGVARTALYAKIADASGLSQPGIEVDFDISGGLGPSTRLTGTTDAQGMTQFAGPLGATGTYRVSISCARGACTGPRQVIAVVR